MRILICFLLLLPVVHLPAQTGSANSTTKPAQGVPLLTLKTNVSALLNPIKQAYAFTADLRLTPRISIDAGAGAFLGSPLQFADQKGESYKGLRLRGGLKYYLFQRNRYAFHVGLEGKYHDIRHISIRNVFRQGQQYIELYPVERHVRTHGLAARAGWQFYFGQNKRLLLEPYCGFGIAWHQVNRILPPDAELIDEVEFISFEYEPGKSVMPDILLGVHFGLALW